MCRRLTSILFLTFAFALTACSGNSGSSPSLATPHASPPAAAPQKANAPAVESGPGKSGTADTKGANGAPGAMGSPGGGGGEAPVTVGKVPLHCADLKQANCVCTEDEKGALHVVCTGKGNGG